MDIPSRSLRYRLAEKLVALFGPKRVFSLEPQKLRRYLERNRGKQNNRPPAFIWKRSAVTEQQAGGRPCYIITPKGTGTEGAGETPQAVLFIHGGGYILEANAIHWQSASRLAGAAALPLWFPVYPLLPDHPIPEAVSSLTAVYTTMLEQYPAAAITVLGDSAGAALALSLCHSIKQRGNALPLPARLILLSPVMRAEDPAMLALMHENEKRDVMLSMRFFASSKELFGLPAEPDNYYTAPMQGDFSGFPALHIFSGGFECGFPQVEAFVRRLTAAGVPVHFYPGPGMMHIWPYLPFCIPECRKALDVIVEILRSAP